jgi:hypothetical protein
MFKRKYEVDEVAYVDEIPGFMKTAGPACIYVYSGVNSDSKSVGVPASFDGAAPSFPLGLLAMRRTVCAAGSCCCCAVHPPLRLVRDRALPRGHRAAAPCAL